MERIALWGQIKMGCAGILLLSGQALALDSGLYPEARFGAPPESIDYGVPIYSAKNPDHAQAYAARPRMKEELADEGDGVTRGIASVQAVQKQGPLNAEGTSILKNVAKRSGVQEVSLIVSELGFYPKQLFVIRDLPVQLYVTGASKRSLCILMDAFQVKRQIRSQKVEEISFTPHHPGEYRYYCPVNNTEGKLIVKELVTQSAE